MKRRALLTRAGVAAAAASTPLAALGVKVQSAADRWRAIGMRVDANSRLDYPYPNVTHSIWAPFRDETGYQLIGFLDRLGRFITDSQYHQ